MVIEGEAEEEDDIQDLIYLQEEEKVIIIG